MTQKTLAAAILDLHKPWYEAGGERVAHRVLVGSDVVPKDHICHIFGLDACSPEEHYVDACIECRQMDEDCGPASLLWPCPTARLALSDDAPPAEPDPTSSDASPCLNGITGGPHTLTAAACVFPATEGASDSASSDAREEADDVLAGRTCAGCGGGITPEDRVPYGFLWLCQPGCES